MSFNFDSQTALQAQIRAMGIGIYTGEKRSGVVWQLSSRGHCFPSIEEIDALVSEALSTHKERPESIEIYTRTGAQDHLDDRFPAPNRNSEIALTAKRIWFSHYEFVVGRMEDSLLLTFSFTLVTLDGSEATRSFKATDGIYPTPRHSEFITALKSAISEIDSQQHSLRYSVTGPRDLNFMGSSDVLDRHSLEKQIYGCWGKYKSFWTYVPEIIEAQ